MTYSPLALLTEFAKPFVDLPTWNLQRYTAQADTREIALIESLSTTNLERKEEET